MKAIYKFFAVLISNLQIRSMRLAFKILITFFILNIYLSSITKENIRLPQKNGVITDLIKINTTKSRLCAELCPIDTYTQ